MLKEVPMFGMRRTLTSTGAATINRFGSLHLVELHHLSGVYQFPVSLEL